jgi:hypothetical protein
MKRNQSIRKVWFYKMWGRVEKGFEIQTFQKEFEIPIQQRYFYNWIVQLNKSRDFEQALDFASMMLVNSASRLFLLWIRLSKLYQQKKVWNTRMLKLKFEKWIGKSRKIRENSVIGTYGLYQTKLVTFSFQKWFVQVKTSREHERGLYLRYIWKKWRLNCNRNLKEQVLYSKWVEFKSHYVFAKWRQALVVKQLEQIHKKSKLRNLFVKWRYKAKDQFAARLYCYSTLVRSFQEWNHASHEVQSAKVRLH